MKESEKEIAISDIFLAVKRWNKYLLDKWYILLIAGAVGSFVGFLIAAKTKPSYTGKLTFVLSTDSKGGVSGLASQFGLDLGSSSGNDVFSGDNILTLFKSKKMVKGVLFMKPPGENDILANIIAKDWEWDIKWKQNNRVKNLFPFPVDTALLSPIQDSLIREIYIKLLDKHLSVIRTDKKLSVYELTTTSSNEVFSCYLTRFLMDETARFYITTKTSLARQTLKMIEREADSIRSLLSGTIVSTASEVDRTFNLNPALQVQRASVQKGQVRTTVLGTAYGEIVRNLEMARINLQKETPLYQVIDVPELPLKMSKTSKTKAIIIGFFLAILIISFLLLLAKRSTKAIITTH